jgi:hypothetical protein
LVRIAKTAGEFVAAAEASLAMGMSMRWRERADEFLASLSWDSVWQGMNRLITANAAQPQKTLSAGSSSMAQAGPEGARV